MNCLDVWALVPTSEGWANITLRVYADNGGTKLQVAQVQLADATRTTIGGRTYALFAQVRGIAADTFRVEQVTGGLTSTGQNDGEIVLVAWGEDGALPYAGAPSLAGAAGTTDPADGLVSTTGTPTVAQLEGFNGATWDRLRAGLSAVTTAVTGYLVGIPFGKYVAAGVALADGQHAPLQQTSAGILKVAEQNAPGFEDNTNGVAAVIQKPVIGSTYAPTLYTSTDANTGTIKAAAGQLYSLSIRNENAAARYFKLFNKASAPVATDVAVVTFKIAAGAELVLSDFFTDAGAYFSSGIAWAMDTADPITLPNPWLTAATANECAVQAVYK